MADLATGALAQLTEASARDALTRACQRAGLPEVDAELIRLGSNAVFRVDASTIARIAPSIDFRPNVELQIAVSRWLETLGYPATRALDIVQPIDADGRVVAFWESVAAETVYAPIDQVAESGV